MELEPTGNGINPKNMEIPTVFSIRLHPEEKDTVKLEKRNAKDGGVFKQYTLFLTDSEGKERELRFLFGVHLNPLIAAFGKNTNTWFGKTVLVTPMQKGEFWDVEIAPASV